MPVIGKPPEGGFFLAECIGPSSLYLDIRYNDFQTTAGSKGLPRFIGYSFDLSSQTPPGCKNYLI